jgi:hypothetical protein
MLDRSVSLRGGYTFQRETTTNKQTDAAASDDFDLAKIDAAFQGSFSGGMNACIDCCDRHVGSGRAALKWIGSDGGTQTVSYEYQRNNPRGLPICPRHGLWDLGTALPAC